MNQQPIGERTLALGREGFSPIRLSFLIALLGLASVAALRAEASPAPIAPAVAPAATASALSALPGVTAQAATLANAAVAAHGHRHGHYRHRYRYPRSHGFYFGFPYFSLGYYGHGYYGHHRYGYHRYPPYGYYGRGYYRSGSEPLGGVDIDVKPKKAEVFLDGRAIGTVRQFDGYPSYLWLEQGTYELAIYMDGYQTLEREIAVLPGVVIDVEGQLVPGKAVRPEAPADAAPRDLSGGDVSGGDVSGGGYDRPPRAERAPSGAGEPSRLAVSVSPADAAVYLDGHFLGTAEDLARLSAGMMVSPGRHSVEVVRPGYRSTTREIEIRPGQRFELDLDLERR